MKATDLQSLLREYFKFRHSPFDRYTFTVTSGWSYEGYTMYAYDRAADWYFVERIPPEDLEAARTLGFGQCIGVHISALADTIQSHEDQYLKSY